MVLSALYKLLFSAGGGSDCSAAGSCLMVILDTKLVIDLEDKMGFGQVAGIYAKSADLTKDNLPYWVKSCGSAMCKGGNKAIWGITSPKYGQSTLHLFFFLCCNVVIFQRLNN